MKFPIDVAHLRRVDSRTYSVMRTYELATGRLGGLSIRGHAVLEAASGSFLGWGLNSGAVIRTAPGAVVDGGPRRD